MAGKDENYIIDLCDEVLGQESSRQHRFDFLRGDGDRAVPLPVDAYYPDLKLVIEYRERQHVESVEFWDKKPTVSGMSRGRQRALYDQRRRDVLPQHGIVLVELTFSDFPHGNNQRLLRRRDEDIAVVSAALKKWVAMSATETTPSADPSARSAKFNWSRLNHLQVGRYAEYFVMMELTMHGVDIYSAEVDDKGVDFVARAVDGRFFEIQVKSIREAGYIFHPKRLFPLNENLLSAIVVFRDGLPPNGFLIPATEWKTPNDLLRDRPYEGKKSEPEWGVNVSRKNWHLLERYAIEDMVQAVFGASSQPRDK